MKTTTFFNILPCTLCVFIIISCTEKPTLPQANTGEISEITQTSAICNAEVVSEGGEQVLERGICWSTQDNPGTDDNKISDKNTGLGMFNCIIVDLNPRTTYYVRAYALNSLGTAYGALKVFKTLNAIIPVVSTTELGLITTTSVICGGEVSFDGGYPVLEKGICWSMQETPTTGDSLRSAGSGTGSYSTEISGLIPGNSYHVRAYAVNSVGTAYGEIISFETRDTIPVLSTFGVSEITLNTARCGGEISFDGGDSISAKGVCWSTGENPTIADSRTTDGSGSGSFVSRLDGLTPGTVYYVRAYATNGVGTGYGDVQMFKTVNDIPVVNTAAVTEVTLNSALCGGEISFDGGAKVTAKGVCWSTGENPTIADSKTTDGSGSGSFVSRLDGLIPGTVYYVRAYATNGVGTGYGDVQMFKTYDLPEITTNEDTEIRFVSAISGGTITSDGGVAITSRGVCWSTSPDPTIALSTKTVNGSGMGSFISELSDLTPGTTYYVRAYATNKFITVYGNTVTFDTKESVSGTFTDGRDGIRYRYINIGDQIWMAENLKYLPSVVGSDSTSETTPFYYVYDYEGTNLNNARTTANYKTYGVLYNWPAAMAGASSSTANPSGVQGVCPSGWHLPSNAEWYQLANQLGGDMAGGKLKESGTSHWDSPNQGASNESGFTALPSGAFIGYGAFSSKGMHAKWWTATGISGYFSDHAYHTELMWVDERIFFKSIYKYSGHAVRCVKD